MAKIPGLNLEESEVSQEFDLGELLNVDEVPGFAKTAFAQAAIDKILERTSDGEGNNGRPLKKPYSKIYQASLDYRAAGKSANEINMALSGDMLGSIQVLEESGSRVTIGLTGNEAAKAHGHMTGAEGRLPVRPFFGLNKSEIEEIVSNIEDEIPQEPSLADVLGAQRTRRGFFG